MAHSRIPADLDPQRICIIKPSAFGDIVQSLPLIGALRDRFPGAAISWVVREDLQDLLAGHPDLTDCLVYRRRKGPAAFSKLLRQIRWQEFDLAIDLQGLLRSGVMTLATRAPVRVGLETAREGASLACNVVVPGTTRSVPAAERYWRVAEAICGKPRPQQAKVFVPHHDWEWARSALASLPRPVIAVHAGAMWETKRCPPELFASVLQRAQSRFGGSIVLLGGADDEPVATHLQSLVMAGDAPHPLNAPIPDDTIRNLTGATTLKQLTALLTDADVLLCNDSGPMHLAAAVGTPVVGLFTCTSPALSGPPGAQHELIAADVPCAASYQKTCPWQGSSHMQCHLKLPVERIFRSLEAILAPQLPRTADMPVRCQLTVGKYETASA